MTIEVAATAGGGALCPRGPFTQSITLAGTPHIDPLMRLPDELLISIAQFVIRSEGSSAVQPLRLTCRGLNAITQAVSTRALVQYVADAVAEFVATVSERVVQLLQTNGASAPDSSEELQYAHENARHQIEEWLLPSVYGVLSDPARRRVFEVALDPRHPGFKPCIGNVLRAPELLKKDEPRQVLDVVMLRANERDLLSIAASSRLWTRLEPADQERFMTSLRKADLLNVAIHALGRMNLAEQEALSVNTAENINDELAEDIPDWETLDWFVPEFISAVIALPSASVRDSLLHPVVDAVLKIDHDLWDRGRGISLLLGSLHISSPLRTKLAAGLCENHRAASEHLACLVADHTEFGGPDPRDRLTMTALGPQDVDDDVLFNLISEARLLLPAQRDLLCAKALERLQSPGNEYLLRPLSMSLPLWRQEHREDIIRRSLIALQTHLTPHFLEGLGTHFNLLKREDQDKCVGLRDKAMKFDEELGFDSLLSYHYQPWLPHLDVGRLSKYISHKVNKAGEDHVAFLGHLAPKLQGLMRADLQPYFKAVRKELQKPVYTLDHALLLVKLVEGAAAESHAPPTK